MARQPMLNATEIANYIIETGATRRHAAEHFGCAKNTVDHYMSRLTGELSEQVAAIAKRNKSVKPATIATTNPVELTVTERTTASATGNRIGGNSHPVIDITSGEVYTSSADAAEKIGVHQTAMSWHVTGRSRTCKGHKFCKVSELSENITAISEAIKTANAKAEAAKTEADAKIADTNAIAMAQINELHAKNAMLSDAVAPLTAIKETKAALAEHRSKAEELRVAFEAELRAIEDAERKLAELYEAL